MRVYLAGGFKNGWQDTVIDYFSEHKGIEFFDPRTNETDIAAVYTLKDLHEIRKCDVMFSYLEDDNPGAYNLAFEMGYASAKGIPIIFVGVPGHYFTMPVVVSDNRSILTLNDGIQLLDMYYEEYYE